MTQPPHLYEIEGTFKSNIILERDIQFAIEKDITQGLKLKSLGCEYPTDKGRIDILCIDNENHPVIIECKRNMAEYSTIAQVISYRTYLINNKDDIEVNIAKSFGADIKVDWSLIRCICVAESFGGRCIDAAIAVQDIPNVQIEFIEYTMLDELKFTLKTVPIEYKKQTISVIDTDGINNAFWAQINGKNNDFDEMFKNAKTQHERYLGKAATPGARWYVIVTSEDVYTELYFSNKNKYLDIYSHKKEIESDFGSILDWTEDSEKRVTCRVHHRVKIGGINDKDKWDDIQNELVEKTMQLVNVFQKYL